MYFNAPLRRRHTLLLKRRLPINGVTSAFDLASCEQNSCLYSCNLNGGCVFKIDAKENTTNWTTKRSTQSLSVTAKSNVLLTSSHTSKLIEYTADVNLLKEIVLQPVSKYLLHSAQLSNDQFLVHSDGSDKCVCVINNDG